MLYSDEADELRNTYRTDDALTEAYQVMKEVYELLGVVYTAPDLKDVLIAIEDSREKIRETLKQAGELDTD